MQGFLTKPKKYNSRVKVRRVKWNLTKKQLTRAGIRAAIIAKAIAQVQPLIAGMEVPAHRVANRPQRRQASPTLHVHPSAVLPHVESSGQKIFRRIHTLELFRRKVVKAFFPMLGIWLVTTGVSEHIHALWSLLAQVANHGTFL